MTSFSAKLALLCLVPLAFFATVPTAANAYSWWSGWESYGECTAYYEAHPTSKSPSETCEFVYVRDRKEAAEREEAYQHIVLKCRAASVTMQQTGACVALATGK